VRAAAEVTDITIEAQVSSSKDIDVRGLPSVKGANSKQVDFPEFVASDPRSQREFFLAKSGTKSDWRSVDVSIFAQARWAKGRSTVADTGQSDLSPT
jgi:hypothetical protein